MVIHWSDPARAPRRPAVSSTPAPMPACCASPRKDKATRTSGGPSADEAERLVGAAPKASSGDEDAAAAAAWVGWDGEFAPASLVQAAADAHRSVHDVFRGWQHISAEDSEHGDDAYWWSLETDDVAWHLHQDIANGWTKVIPAAHNELPFYCHAETNQELSHLRERWPISPGWERVIEADGQVYFWHPESGGRQWDDPAKHVTMTEEDGGGGWVKVTYTHPEPDDSGSADPARTSQWLYHPQTGHAVFHADAYTIGQHLAAAHKDAHTAYAELATPWGQSEHDGETMAAERYRKLCGVYAMSPTLGPGKGGAGDAEAFKTFMEDEQPIRRVLLPDEKEGLTERRLRKELCELHASVLEAYHNHPHLPSRSG
eukprot:SAG31_NODE_4324_length_3357_cov_2.015347_5_plen_372_part_00